MISVYAGQSKELSSVRRSRSGPLGHGIRWQPAFQTAEVSFPMTCSCNPPRLNSPRSASPMIRRGVQLAGKPVGRQIEGPWVIAAGAWTQPCHRGAARPSRGQSFPVGDTWLSPRTWVPVSLGRFCVPAHLHPGPRKRSVTIAGSPRTRWASTRRQTRQIVAGYRPPSPMNMIP